MQDLKVDMLEKCRMDNFEGVKNWFLASCYS